VAKKVIANLLILLMAQKAVCIATFVRKSYATGILNRLFGRPKQAVHG
jgi:N-formylglutamate amidohydrolase